MPQHRYDLALTDHYAPLISEALLAAFPEAALRRVVEQVSSMVVKAADPERDVLRDAARAALSAPNGTDLEQVLRQVFADAYGAGGHAAEQQLAGVSGGAVVTLAGVSAVDWSSWKPGDPAAAALLSNGGLSRLLNDAQVSVNGITGTLLDQLGNAIGTGVAGGDSVDKIGRSLGGIISDPSRAEMIAHTETARAMTAATLDSYSANGVGLWDWILSDGACPECEDAAAGNPHRLDDVAPPLHPRCRCAAAPHVESVASAAGGAGSAPLASDEVASAFGDAEAAAAADEALTAADEAAAVSLPEDLTAASESDLAALLTSTEDDAAIDRIVAELERRDAADAEARAAEERKAAQAAARSEKAQALEADRNARYEEALARGDDPIESYAEIWGKDPERVRIQAAMASLRAAGYEGRNFEELCMSQFKEYAEQSWEKAEAETRGVLLNPAGEKAGINPRSLFTGQDARARKYASEELLGYWQQTGRLTLNDFMSANLGLKGEAAGKAYYL